jgi:hypothetical protein
MRKSQIVAIENNPEVQQIFRDTIQYIASGQLIALAGISTPNGDNYAQAIMAQRMDKILLTMLAMQGVDFSGGTVPPATPEQAKGALLSFVRACINLQDENGKVLWPYASVDEVCFAIEDGTFQAVATQIVTAYYKALSAPLAAQPMQLLGFAAK